MCFAWLQCCITLPFSRPGLLSSWEVWVIPNHVDENSLCRTSRIKRLRTIFECNQAIKVKFLQSKILIPVANGSTCATSVTTLVMNTPAICLLRQALWISLQSSYIKPLSITFVILLCNLLYNHMVSLLSTETDRFNVVDKLNLLNFWWTTSWPHLIWKLCSHRGPAISKNPVQDCTILI